MADANIHEYPGEQVDVRWDRRLCIHVGECGRSEGPLFTSGRDRSHEAAGFTAD